MAQPSNKNNFAADTAQYLQQFQTLSQRATQQKQQFETNQKATQQLQQNLDTHQHSNNLSNNVNFNQSINNNNNNNTNGNTNNNDEVKEMENKMSTMKIKQNQSQQIKQMSGIDERTQGDITIHRGNKEVKSNHYQSSKYKDFASMNKILRQELLDGCDKLNFLHPSKIQAEAIPRCLSNEQDFQYPNLIGQAHHGSGKTATFALIMLQRIDENNTDLQGLVIVHSRELAIQTYNVCQSLGQFIQNLKISLGLKGESIPSPWDCQIVVGTPGTIIDKYLNANKRTMNGLKGFLKSFKILIVDEADEFLKSQSKKQSVSSSNNRGRGRGRGRSNRGQSSFGSLFDQLKMITDELTMNAPKFQTLLFSATYPTTVKKLALEIAPNPFIIKVERQAVQLDNIRIFKLVCNDEIDKFNTLLKVISLSNIGQMIIFVNTVSRAKQLIDGLESKDIGISCSALYGRGMDIKLRDQTMDQFRKNQTQCLVASNVIARGIDVPAVGLVVNFDIPVNQGKSSGKNGIERTGLTFDSETFMHRVGRTGRFGAKGVCINLVSLKEPIANDRLDAIQKEYSLDISLLDNSSKSIKSTITEWLR